MGNDFSRQRSPGTLYERPQQSVLQERPPVFGRDEAVKPYSSPPQTAQPEELAYSFVPEPPPPPRNYAQPMWRWMLQDIGRRTVGVARVDLVRYRVPTLSETGSLWQAGPEAGSVSYPSVYGGGSRFGGGGGGSAYSRMTRPQYGPDGTYLGVQERGGLFALGASRGARIKVMRCIEFGRPERQVVPAPAGRNRGGSQQQQTVGSRLLSTLRPQAPVAGPWGGAARLKPALLSFGVGANFELDNMALALQTRVKFQDWLTFKLSPVPAIKLQKSIQLGNTPVCLRVQYEVPLDGIDEPLKAPARFFLRLDNHVGSGLRLGTTGVEIDQRVISLGPNAAVRFAGLAKFPRQLPVKEGEQLIDWQIDRLGLKTRW